MKSSTKKETIKFRVDKEGLQLFERKRQEMQEKLGLKKLSRSDFCRICIFQDSANDNLILKEELSRLIYQVRKIGVNINQIAKCINEGFYVVGEENLKRELPEVKNLLSQVEKRIAGFSYRSVVNGDYKINEHKSQ